MDFADCVGIRILTFTKRGTGPTEIAPRVRVNTRGCGAAGTACADRRETTARRTPSNHCVQEDVCSHFFRRHRATSSAALNSVRRKIDRQRSARADHRIIPWALFAKAAARRRNGRYRALVQEGLKEGLKEGRGGEGRGDLGMEGLNSSPRARSTLGGIRTRVKGGDVREEEDVGITVTP